MSLTEHNLRMNLLDWVQRHTILRRGNTGENPRAAIVVQGGHWVGLVSDNEAIEELLECVSARKVVEYDRFTELNPMEQMQVDAVARELTRCGGYIASPTDAVTDAIGIVKAAFFAPPLGDNHHNALECPHCMSQAPQEPPQGP